MGNVVVVQFVYLVEECWNVDDSVHIGVMRKMKQRSSKNMDKRVII